MAAPDRHNQTKMVKEWSDSDEFAGLIHFLNILVHVVSHDCVVEGYLRVCENDTRTIILERYERSFRHEDGYWEHYPGNQMDTVQLHIPLIKPHVPTYISIGNPVTVLRLGNSEIIATSEMDEDYNYPNPPQQVVPNYRVFNYHAVADVISALYNNALAVVHLSYGEQNSGGDAVGEYLNSQRWTGVEGRILQLETVLTTCATHVCVTLEVWERFEYGHTYVKRPHKPRVVRVSAPWGCRVLRKIGAEEVYCLN
jgi:hypothetical protein